jgi:hypothetical protein
MGAVKKKDLIAEGFPRKLDWHTEQRWNSLDLLYDFVIRECEKAVNWYYLSKKSKSWLGYILRAGSTLAIAVAGVIPIIGEIYERSDGSPLISPAWATVALAIAALFVALDRFGGYTSGWVRYVRTAQRLCILQADFCLDWEEYRFRCPQLTAEETREGILLCRTFLQNVNLEVQNETSAWAQEFQQALLEVDGLSKSKPKEAL